MLAHVQRSRMIQDLLEHLMPLQNLLSPNNWHNKMSSVDSNIQELGLRADS